tara:strand:+ start:31 stop:411 length:381 start_codon:yes stop_codon:yes gene_type:complete
MKKYILLLIIPFLSFGQATLDTELLNVGMLLDYYPNAVCGYYDEDGNMLFDGGDFNANSPDAEKVWTYECPMWQGSFGDSDGVLLKFWAWSDGRISFSSLEFRRKENLQENAFKFYVNQKGEMIFE